jgi:hypothetical protein
MFHYADIVKDVLLICHIWVLMFGGDSADLVNMDANFPVLAFWVILVSIVTSETTTCFTMMTNDQCFVLDGAKRIIFLLLLPLIPAITLVKDTKIELKQIKAFKKVNRLNIDPAQEALLSNILKNKLAVRSLRADLRANENVVEHSVQLVLLLLILLTQRTKTAKVVSLDKIFLSNDDNFILLSTGLSFLPSADSKAVCRRPRKHFFDALGDQ